MSVEIEAISRHFSRLLDLEREMEKVIALRRALRLLSAKRSQPDGSRRARPRGSLAKSTIARPSSARTSLSRR